MLQVLIIEDEPLAVQNLQQMLLETDPSITILANIGTIRDAVAWLQQNSADLIFLDIHLSDGLSFAIFEQLHISTPIIFTTAYDQYAIKAFEVNSVDYLLKPIKTADLQRAVNKYRNNCLTSASMLPIDVKRLIEQINGKKSWQQRFMVQSGTKLRSIETDQIAYFFVVQKACFMRLFSGENYDIDYSLDKLETIINPELFFRVNRQTVVNIKAIKMIHILSNRSLKLDIHPKPDDDIIVSVHRLTEFRQWLNK